MSGLNSTKAFTSATGTVAGTAMGLTNATFAFTAANLLAADVVYIQVRVADLAITYDGGTALATDYIVSAGDTIEIRGSHNIQALSLIRATGASSTVHVVLEQL